MEQDSDSNRSQEDELQKTPQSIRRIPIEKTDNTEMDNLRQSLTNKFIDDMIKENNEKSDHMLQEQSLHVRRRSQKEYKPVKLTSQLSNLSLSRAKSALKKASTQLDLGRKKRPSTKSKVKSKTSLTSSIVEEKKQSEKKTDALELTTFYISEWNQTTHSFRQMLNTSKGRDKFCQLLQYIANFYLTCMRNSEDFKELVAQKKIRSVVNAKTFEKNISDGRKIFRLLLFFNEMAEIDSLMKDKKMVLPLKSLKIVSAFCSFHYYLTDNIVWFANMGFISKFYYGDRKWKSLKNIFSLAKTILEIIISIYQVLEKKKKERALWEKLMKYQDEMVSPDTEWYVLVRDIIIVRRQKGFHVIEAIIYVLRMMLLISSLKLVGHDYLDPIFVSGCGLGQALFTVFKSMKGKKPFFKLSTEDLNKKKENNGNTKAKNEQSGVPLVRTKFVPASLIGRDRVFSDEIQHDLIQSALQLKYKTPTPLQGFPLNVFNNENKILGNGMEDDSFFQGYGDDNNNQYDGDTSPVEVNSDGQSKQPRLYRNFQWKRYSSMKNNNLRPLKFNVQPEVPLTKEKLIDDVYDERVLLPDHKLESTTRKLDYWNDIVLMRSDDP